MRVLLISDYAAPTGGAEVSLLVLREALRRRGHEVLFLSTRARHEPASEADAHCYGTRTRLRTLLQVANPWAAAAVRRAVAAFRPDVAHVALFLTQLSPLALLPLRGVPTLYHAHWYRATCPTGTRLLPSGGDCISAAGVVCWRAGCVPTLRTAPLLVQFQLLRRAAAFRLVVAPSEAVALALRPAGLGRVVVIPPGVPSRPARPPLVEPPSVVFAARLEHEKGVLVLADAFARARRALPDARLVIVGDGSETTALQERIASHGMGGSVERTGFLERDALERVSNPAWVQAVSSLWAEPFGLVAAEAMMRGTAVIASDTGGLREIVRHGETVLLVPRGDVEQLANALVSVLSDRGRAESYGRAGRVRAEAHYSVEAFAAAFESAYRQIAGNGAGSVA